MEELSSLGKVAPFEINVLDTYKIYSSFSSSGSEFGHDVEGTDMDFTNFSSVLDGTSGLEEGGGRSLRRDYEDGNGVHDCCDMFPFARGWEDVPSCHVGVEGWMIFLLLCTERERRVGMLLVLVTFPHI